MPQVRYNDLVLLDVVMDLKIPGTFFSDVKCFIFE